MSRLTDEPLRALMPALAALPQHPAATRVKFPDRWRGGRLHAWTRPEWWKFQRILRAGEYSTVARIYVNGGGRDHELRFEIEDLRRQPSWSVAGFDMPACPSCKGTGTKSWRRGDHTTGNPFGGDPDEIITQHCTATGCRDGRMTRYGAANDFQFTPGIEPFLGLDADGRFPMAKLEEGADPNIGAALRQPWRTLGHRGLYGFLPDDVINVARWADTILAVLYPPLDTKTG